MYIKYIEQFAVLELMQVESLSQCKRKDEKKIMSGFMLTK